MKYDDKPCNEECIPRPLGNTLDLTDPIEDLFMGVYNSVAEMEQEKPSHKAKPGSYGYVVSHGRTQIVTLENAKWFKHDGVGNIAMDAKVIKDLYESNHDTNVLNDHMKHLLDNCFCGGTPALPVADGEYKLRIVSGVATWVKDNI